MVLGEIIFGEVFGSHSTLIIRLFGGMIMDINVKCVFVFIFFVIFYVSYDCDRCYAKINPIVEKDNWPSRLFYISFILIAIIIPRI